MFVSFASDSGIRFDAHFYDAPTDKVEARPVVGWVTGDDGLSQACILVPDSGLQVRVGSFSNFLAVVPKGQEEQHKALIDAKVAALKAKVEAPKLAAVPDAEA